MSEQKPAAVEDPEDEDLADLLDSALKDFKRPPPSGAVQVQASAGGPSSGAPATGASGSSVDVDDDFMLDPAQMQKAAADFHSMMRQLAEVQKVLETNDDGSGGQDTDLSAEEASYAKSLLENMNFLADKAQKVSEASTEDNFKEAMDSLHSDDAFENQFLPFILGFMGTLLSKEMLYPSLSEIRDKFPAWIEEHKHELSPNDLTRYEQQLDVIKQICAEFENEKEDDPEPLKEERFHKIMILLQKMQALGHPPQELAGDLPPGWGMDTGSQMPTVTDSKLAAESCSLM